MTELPRTPLYERAWVGPAITLKHLLALLGAKGVISESETASVIDQALGDLDQIPTLQGEEYLTARLTVHAIKPVV